MRLLIATDSFPPGCGGSGWSTYELCRGLRSAGHEITVVRPVPGRDERVREAHYDLFRVLEFGTAAPRLPYVRNYFKNERLYRRLEPFLAETIRRERLEIVHAQHVLTAVPSVAAARHVGVPVVCTVRDYWPVCYWSDLIHTSDEPGLCPACSAGMMTQCIRPRAGALWPAALPMIPYMRANLRRKREGLSGADTIVTVSSVMAADLLARAPELAGAPIEVVPNPVHIGDLRARAESLPREVPEPYALYAGKLAPNKGSAHLVPVVETAALDWPLIVAGDGPERATVQAAARRSLKDVRLLGWTDERRTASLMAHASMLIFPSRGPESLSRVLIEASALGVPIAAMHTGGTADIVVHESSGLLSRTPQELAQHVRRLRDEPATRERLGHAARDRAASLFDARAVVSRIEAIYRRLLERRA